MGLQDNIRVLEMYIIEKYLRITPKSEELAQFILKPRGQQMLEIKAWLGERKAKAIAERDQLTNLKTQRESALNQEIASIDDLNNNL